MLELARQHLAYTVWADRQHLRVLEQLPAEHLTVDTGTSFGTLLGTMAHILGGEQVWLSRFLGDPLDRLPGQADYPDLEALRLGFQEHGAGLEFFLASLTAEQLDAEVCWQTGGGSAYCRPLWQPLMHMVHHSGYHRGQMTTMLRQLGWEPPATDLIDYLLSR